MSTTSVDDAMDTSSQKLAAGSLILYYCVAHLVWAEDRSPVTRYRDAWAFCVNGCGGGHDWRRIAPVSYPELRGFGPTFMD